MKLPIETLIAKIQMSTSLLQRYMTEALMTEPIQFSEIMDFFTTSLALQAYSCDRFSALTL